MTNMFVLIYTTDMSQQTRIEHLLREPEIINYARKHLGNKDLTRFKLPLIIVCIASHACGCWLLIISYN